MALDCNALARNCASRAQERVKLTNDAKDEVIHAERSVRICSDRCLRGANNLKSRQPVYYSNQRTLFEASTYGTAEENFLCGKFASLCTKLGFQFCTPSEAVVQKWNVLHSQVLLQYLTHYENSKRLHEYVPPASRRPSGNTKSKYTVRAIKLHQRSPEGLGIEKRCCDIR